MAPTSHEGPATSHEGPAAPVTSATKASDRRQHLARRNPSDDRLSPPVGDTGDDFGILPRSWLYLLAIFPAVVIFNAALSRSLPPVVAIACFVLSLAGIGALPLARRVERRPNGGVLRRGCLALSVLVPLAFFGFGVVEWHDAGTLPTQAAICILLAVGTVASAHLRRQAGLIVAGQLALWLPAIGMTSLVHAEALLGLGALSVLVASRVQAKLDGADLQRHMARERAQTRARDILADYEETGQGWFWETDRRSQLAYVSGAVANSLGRTAEVLVGRPLTLLFDLKQAQEGERTLMFHLSARSAFQELPVKAAIDGEDRWWSVSGRPIYDQFDNFVGFRGSGTDLTEKRRSQENVSRLANYDSLTGLANRLQMSQSLEKILASPQESHRSCAVLLLDLDRFKHVNDTRGHPVGDALLRQVAQRLERTVGKAGRVGRLGGDEFQIIVPKRTDRTRLGDLAKDIIHSLSQPYSIDGHSIIIGASVGIALSPNHGTTSDDLIRNADLALYAAKDAGRGRHHFYAESLHAAAQARAEVEKELRNAIVQGDLQLFYQPVVATASEQIAGFEALLRWKHPKHGWIAPDKFVGIAEDAGLICQIGERALRTACRDLATWPEDVRCAVNVSPLQFVNKELPSIVTNAIAQAGIKSSRLELEITESVFLNDDEGTDAMFAALKRIGVRLALDDFGTGYSSLGYLKKAPFDKIKIDQSFVRGATEPGSRTGAIIASITSLAHALGMDTTAEGVETLDELDLVRMHGCSHVQGFIYERPLDCAAATERLRTGLAAVAKGPRSARAARQTMLRKVMLDHHGQSCHGTIRNISSTGALVEGLWNVPVGTIFTIQLTERQTVTATTRWCAHDRVGLEFARPLPRDASARIEAVDDQITRPRRPLVHKAGYDLATGRT
ncbi:MAG TPA: EAL domain-containing protein [Croceibacterium sp.]|nr:EAL domain-containing protein [Croceibacterium sp.]